MRRPDHEGVTEGHRTSPYVSVIIPTLNREEPLRRVLSYFVDSESYSPFEVIVVDQSPTHEPATVEYLAALNDKIRLFRIEEKGAGKARNYGAQMAKGSLLLFVDDDDLPQQNFIAGHVTAHENSELAAVSGAVLRPGNHLRTRGELNCEELDNIQVQKDGPRDVDFSYECSWGGTGNLSVKATWFWKVGGFYSKENAAVATGGLDDALFGHILHQHGGRLEYSPLPAIVLGGAETGGCRDLVDSGLRRVLELENSLTFWMLLGHSRLRAVWITLRKMVITPSMSLTLTNLWCLPRALARWVRTTRVECQPPSRTNEGDREVVELSHARETGAPHSVAQLALATAREINDPLTVIIAGLQLTSSRGQLSGEAARYVERAIRAGERIRDIVRDMSDITRLELSREAPRLAPVFGLRESSDPQNGSRSV